MSATITLNSRIENAKKYIKDNFDSTLEGNYSYFYTGRTLPWIDEYSPDVSISTEKEIYEAKFQRVFLKQITVDNTSLAIKRFNWKKNTIYTRADYNINFNDYRNWIHPESPFYVINSEGNVYKCISNGYGSDSTIEPFGQSTSYIFLGDGYIWKFMLDLTTTFSDKFLTDNWIPIPYKDADKSFAQLNIESNAIAGDIAYIHVNNGGDRYVNQPIIEIRGDGIGATATAIMNGETIQSIQVSNAGSGYTHAKIHIFGNGDGAVATAMISPSGGHGSNSVYELGAFYIEINSEIIGDEDGFAPITGTYRNIGIVKNILDKNKNIITDEKFNTLSTINISDCSGTYITNELIIGEDSYAQGILYFDPTGTDKNISMYMIEGDFIDGERLHGQETGEVGIYNESTSTITNVDILSGEVLYKENIIFITRREIQIEKFVFTIEF
jgi:hypothetical protein